MAEQWKEQTKLPAKDILVYRSVRPDACRHCKTLYTVNGTPRVFTLADLESNGPTNAGKRRPDWKPVNGSTHPWCSCVTIRLSRFVEVPAGWKSGETMPKVLGPEGYIR